MCMLSVLSVFGVFVSDVIFRNDDVRMREMIKKEFSTTPRRSSRVTWRSRRDPPKVTFASEGFGTRVAGESPRLGWPIAKARNSKLASRPHEV